MAETLERSRRRSPNMGGLVKSVVKLMRLRRKAAGVVNHSNFSPNDSSQTTTSVQKLKKLSGFMDTSSILSQSEFNEEDEKKRNNNNNNNNNYGVDRETVESLLAALFARIAAIKASYAQMQVAQFPYDPETIQSADRAVVSELKQISQLKHSYFKNQCVGATEGVYALEIQEQRNLLSTFKITTNKLESELQGKTSEINALMGKLQEVEKENRSLELELKGPKNFKKLSALDELDDPSVLNPTHFLTVLRYTYKSVRSFVKLMVSEMEDSGWDLAAAARSIEPDVVHGNPDHGIFAFESFVCRTMFSSFHQQNYGMADSKSLNNSSTTLKSPISFFKEFKETKNSKPKQLSVLDMESPFGKFCRNKYLQLVNPKMESFLFGNLDQRAMLCSGEGVPDTAFFLGFSEMARRIWLLHSLFFSFNPTAEASIFQVSRGQRFSEVYMDKVGSVWTLEDSPESSPVSFTVVPGFQVGKTVIRCKVYLGRRNQCVDERL